MSWTSSARARRWGDATERFWARVNKTDSCWLWTGGLRRKRYGAVQWNGRKRSAHQVAWEIEHGPIPPGIHLLHAACDNPRCVRPSHLKLGTNKENHAERVAKGRSSKHGRFARIAHREGKRIAELEARNG